MSRSNQSHVLSGGRGEGGKGGERRKGKRGREDGKEREGGGWIKEFEVVLLFS